MLIEVMNAEGDFEKVDIREFVSARLPQFLEDARAYGDDLDENTARANPHPSTNK